MKKINKMIMTQKKFVDVYQNYVNIYNQRQRKYSLYEKEADLLIAIFELQKTTDEVNMKEISDKMGITPGAVSQTASRTERKGYIERIASENDSRQRAARLTARGHLFCDGYAKHLEELMSNVGHLFDELSSEDIDTFLMVQEKLIDVMKICLLNNKKL
ncbi:MAG: MarR family winged helix-turn-helix transcriptional regulator [Anaerorhabdus sp.]